MLWPRVRIGPSYIVDVAPSMRRLTKVYGLLTALPVNSFVAGAAHDADSEDRTRKPSECGERITSGPVWQMRENLGWIPPERWLIYVRKLKSTGIQFWEPG
jgi:hypothetical protein